MRYHEFSEAIPAIAGLARGIGMAAGQVGRTVGKAIGKVAAGAEKTATGAAKGIQKTTKPGIGQTLAQTVADKAAAELSQKLLRQGGKIPLPINKPNQTQQFQIDKVQGDEVTLTDPMAKKNPGQPSKFVVNKQDLDPVIKGMMSQDQKNASKSIGRSF